MALQPWKRIEPTTVTKVGWRTIVSKTFEQANGEQVVFDTVYPEGQEFAMVIALTPDNQVLLARQFRPGPEVLMDEIPSGYVDTGETHEQAARRELLEETGYKAERMEYLGGIHKDAIMNGTWHGYMAYGCYKVSDTLGVAEEDIELRTVSIVEFIEIAKRGGMTDPIFVLMAYEKLQELM